LKNDLITKMFKPVKTQKYAKTGRAIQCT